MKNIHPHTTIPRTRLYYAILLLLFGSITFPNTAWSKPLKRNALLIGNSIYFEAPLASPATDIAGMSKALKQSQFKIQKKTNLRQGDFNEVISEYSRTLRENRGIGIFYYAGYAAQFEETNYLIPVDAAVTSEKEIPSIGFALSDVMEVLEASGAPFNIVILEAGYLNPFGKKVPLSKPGLAEIDVPDGFLVATACSPDQGIRSDNIRSSRFTASLSALLSTPDLELADIFKKTIKSVSSASKKKQVPWMTSSIRRGLSINYPRRDFFYLLREMDPYQAAWQTNTNLRGVYQAWKNMAETYPRWFSSSSSGDLKDVIIQAIDDDLEGYFYTMVHDFDIDLSRINSLGMKFVYIPPGKFTMGSQFDEPGRGKDEMAHRVTLTRGFFVQSTELTQGDWQSVMGENPSNFDDCGLDCPMENVSWNDVQEFIDRLNMLEDTSAYRLPTEAEWEYAARSDSITWYHFGNEAHQFGDYAWYKSNSKGTSHPVAQKKPNEWGLYDVHGNVWEWCQSRGGSYPKGSATNPTGSSGGKYRVVRGGSWFYSMLNARSANRFYLFPDDRNYTVGFRLAHRSSF